MMEHKRFALSLQVPEAFVAPNGSMLKLAPGEPGIIDEAPSGRIHLDGKVPVAEGDGLAKARRSLGFAGFAGVTVIVDKKGRAATSPALIADGVPETVVAAMRSAATDAAYSGRFDDDEEAAERIRRAVRREAQSAWGKRPVVRVEIVRL